VLTCGAALSTEPLSPSIATSAQLGVGSAPNTLVPVLSNYGDPTRMIIGSQAAVTFPKGATSVTVLNPEFQPLVGGHLDSNRTTGAISIQFFSTIQPAASPPGLLALRAKDFSCRDESGRLISLRTTQAEKGYPRSSGVAPTHRRLLCGLPDTGLGA
jgi:hypothetical protein